MDRNGSEGSVALGRMVAGPCPGRPEILCDDPLLRPHLRSPWLRAEVGRLTGVPLAGAALAGTPAGGDLALPLHALARHAVVVGSTGSGKTYLVLHIIRALLSRWSVVVVDPKGELSELVLRSLAAAEGPAPELTLLDPRRGILPGLNPFLAGLPSTRRPGELVGILERLYASSWGPRLSNLLTAVTWVAAAHRLSLVETVRMLLDPEYLERLLALPVGDAPPAFRDVAVFLRREYLSWTASARREASSAVLNKLWELLRVPELQAMLCSGRNTFDFPSLWRRRQVVAVRLDRPTLGAPGCRLLAALLTHMLYRAALTEPGPVPVLLVLDELPLYEKLVGGVLDEIVAVARSLRLHLVAVCQHLEQLSAPLREGLLANAGLVAHMRLGHGDSALAASAMAAGTRETVLRARLVVEYRDRKQGVPEMSSWCHPIEDARGHRLRVGEVAWRELERDGTAAGDPLGPLERLARSAGTGRLYVPAADSGQPREIRNYVRGLPPDSIRLEGPALSLVVSYPRPRVTGVDRFTEADAARAWARQLQQMPERHAAVRILGVPQGLVRLPDLDVRIPDPERLGRILDAARASHGLGRAEVEGTRARRETEIERVLSGAPAHTETAEAFPAGDPVRKDDGDDTSLF